MGYWINLEGDLEELFVLIEQAVPSIGDEHRPDDLEVALKPSYIANLKEHVFDAQFLPILRDTVEEAVECLPDGQNLCRLCDLFSLLVLERSTTVEELVLVFYCWE